MNASRIQSPDTTEDVERILIVRYRSMTPRERLAMTRELSRAGQVLALAGLRIRNPHADASALRMRLASLRIPPGLMERARGRSVFRSSDRPRRSLQAVFEVIDVLEELELNDAVGGSVASSVLGELRASADADMLVELTEEQLPRLLAALEDDVHVPEDAATEAVRVGSSFDVVHLSTAYEVDLFVTGSGPLDQERPPGGCANGPG